MPIHHLKLAALTPLIMTALAACQTTNTPTPTPQSPSIETQAPDAPDPRPAVDNAPVPQSAPIASLPPPQKPPLDPAIVSPPEPPAPETSVQTPNQTSGPISSPSNIGSTPIVFSDYLPGWDGADLRPALTAFARSCDVWGKRSADKLLKSTKPEFGHYKDWQTACFNLPPAPYSADLSRWFFETQFLPNNLVSSDQPAGLLTGYYEPEIDVRAAPDGVFSEPILARPSSEALQNRARNDIITGQASYQALAYGRPVDVFFMQVQGSGRLRFQDGLVSRAAFGGHNGHKYKSIGAVLVKRGEITLEEASKQAIENWMFQAGTTATRDLMNQNPRYIYFALQEINPDEGPKGSFGVPLTAKGSFAIDPKARPYGVPVWLETRLPQFSGDFTGQAESLLVVAQDSGSAIKGEGRGDLFFGSGDLAGELAGVMKHDVVMTHLLPRSLVLAAMGANP